LKPWSQSRASVVCGALAADIYVPPSRFGLIFISIVNWTWCTDIRAISWFYVSVLKTITKNHSKKIGNIAVFVKLEYRHYIYSFVCGIFSLFSLSKVFLNMLLKSAYINITKQPSNSWESAIFLKKKKNQTFTSFVFFSLLIVERDLTIFVKKNFTIFRKILNRIKFKHLVSFS